MKPHHFVEKLRDNELVEAIRKAERKTSGEIRVFISRKPVEAPVSVAQAHFLEMGMDKTRDRNAVLIFVAPRTHKFAVIGDKAVHERCGDAFWLTLANEMTGHFKNSHFTEGLLHAITKAGELLAQHFPRRPDDTNELPDDIERD
ncbi:MAG TPA: TPM domain-containing protein [Verrucomicrobiae bacterium]|nr:TPM domain-containing protein [Verrucomicrobiae bacterium]